jgi:hypothetical protein
LALPTAGPTVNVTIWLAPAARVNVELVEELTPFGKLPMVTLTVPLNPLIGFAVTLMGTLVVVWAVNSELGETESEKLGGGGGGAGALPPPHPAIAEKRMKSKPAIRSALPVRMGASRQKYAAN